MVNRIILSAKPYQRLKLTPAITYYLTNISMLKDNVETVKEVNTGIVVECSFKAGKRKLEDLKRSIKTFTGAGEVGLVYIEDV